MTRPARRGKGAVGAVVSTIVDVLTLPFRVIGRLFGGGDRHRRTRAH